MNKNRHVSPFLRNNSEDAEYEAKKLLASIEWDRTIPVDLIEICEYSDIDVVFSPFAEDRGPAWSEISDIGFKIYLNTVGEDNPSTFSNQDVSRRRQRFSLAHEIAHCTYKSHSDNELQTDLRQENNPYARRFKKFMEADANLFASYLLMPRDVFQEHVRNIGWNSIPKLALELSRRFDVSLQASILHIARLANHSCLSVLYDNNGNYKNVCSYSTYFADIGLYFDTDQPLPNGSAARTLMRSRDKTEHIKKHRDASVWFNHLPHRRVEEYEVDEVALSLGKYGIAVFLEVDRKDYGY